MGKKRKAGQPFGAQKNANLSEENSRARFNINETFDNSENELHAEKDQVLFDTSAQAKRRRVLEEQSMSFSHFSILDSSVLTAHRHCATAVR